MKETENVEYRIIEKVRIYIHQHYNNKDSSKIESELKELCSCAFGDSIVIDDEVNLITYKDLQNILSTINEKSSSRRKNGVYYTENDITSFILENCLKLNLDKSIENITEEFFSEEDKVSVLSMSIFDPTCGAGAFLLTALELKIKLLGNRDLLDKKYLKTILSTLYGNDIDNVSTTITKIRLLLCVLENFGVSYISGLGKILNSNFYSENIFTLKLKNKFDLVIGNPPYVEESATDIKVQEQFGNIYANVLSAALDFMSDTGTYGFIIPLSYISTPRMALIRKKISNALNNQLILSYADRPGCLFTSVHQKLNVLIGSKKGKKEIYTGNYQYWYKDERSNLFTHVSYIKNGYGVNEYIPKLGNDCDISIYRKIKNNTVSVSSLMQEKGACLYLNMRACFWIKAFLEKHATGEYKELHFENDDIKNYMYCIFNSSLFWWFWICISDCWHITNKEFINFKLPISFDGNLVRTLANNLEKRLELTKKFVGTKQTDYEYKHKNCLAEIHEIDDYINSLFGLTENESQYIKSYAISYRTSEGAKK